MQWKNSEQQLSLQMILFLSKNEKNERHFDPFFIERRSWYVCNEEARSFI